MFGWFLQLFSNGFLFFILHLSQPGSFAPPLSAAQEREALAKMHAGDKSARSELIEHNLRLVAHIVKKYYAAYSDQDDLISIGTVGLIKAIDSFKPDKGTRLATYAAKCVENEILMHFRSMKKSAHDISLEDPIDSDSEGNPLTLMDIICTPDCIADDLDLKIKSEKLRGLVIGIPDPREKAIIVMRYGLDGNEPLTQREIEHLPLLCQQDRKARARKARERNETAVRIIPRLHFYFIMSLSLMYFTVSSTVVNARATEVSAAP